MFFAVRCIPVFGRNGGGHTRFGPLPRKKCSYFTYSVESKRHLPRVVADAAAVGSGMLAYSASNARGLQTV